MCGRTSRSPRARSRRSGCVQPRCRGPSHPPASHYESRACRRFRFALVEKPLLIFTDLFARAVGPNHSGPGAHTPGPEGRYGRPTKGKPGGAPRAERKEKPHAITRARRTKRDAAPARPLARGGANGRMGRVMPRPAASPPPPSRAATTRCIPRRAKSPVACTRGGPAPAPNRQWAIGTAPEPRPGPPHRGALAALPAGNRAVPAAGPGPGPPPDGRVVEVKLRPALVGPVARRRGAAASYSATLSGQWPSSAARSHSSAADEWPRHRTR